MDTAIGKNGQPPMYKIFIHQKMKKKDGEGIRQNTWKFEIGLKSFKAQI